MLFCSVLDIFTRQWFAYWFDTLATTDVAMESLAEAVAAAKLNYSRLTVLCNNGFHLCIYLSDRIRLAAVSPTLILRTRTM